MALSLHEEDTTQACQGRDFVLEEFQPGGDADSPDSLEDSTHKPGDRRKAATGEAM